MRNIFLTIYNKLGKLANEDECGQLPNIGHLNFGSWPVAEYSGRVVSGKNIYKWAFCRTYLI